jgi:hypothetical protein
MIAGLDGQGCRASLDGQPKAAVPHTISGLGLRHQRGCLHQACYHGTLVHMTNDSKLLIERVQTGVRMEKRILKVLKAFAEYHDMTLGDLLEGIVLHAFDGKTPFSPVSLERIRDLKKFYELDLDSSASHRLREIKAKSLRSPAPQDVKNK